MTARMKVFQRGKSQRSFHCGSHRPHSLPEHSQLPPISATDYRSTASTGSLRRRSSTTHLDAKAMPAFVSATPLLQHHARTVGATPLSHRTAFCAPIRLRAAMPRPSLARHTPTAQQSSDLAVMVNGVPGRMAAATAAEVVRRGMTLADEALTGAGVAEATFTPDGALAPVRLISPEHHDACLRRVRDKYPRLVIVDYTHPSAANPNVELYAAHGLSFVIGTTGGDVPRMKEAVLGAGGVYAVIAPNMAKQIVAFQAMMDMMASEFPGAFAGYSLTVKESHQATKADTSGTAKSVVGSFTKLGLDFGVDQIEKVREARRSEDEMGVPEEFITAGHAFHTYHLTSSDGSVNFEFQHNVCGRVVYAAGTVDAACFLDAQREKGNEERLFNMIDVLRSGGMS